MNKNYDPYNSVDRVKNDIVGVTKWDKEKVEEGLLVFHTVVGNRILVTDMTGKYIMEFKHPPSNYTMYRPPKISGKRNLVCILIDEKDRNKRCVASLDENGKIIWKTSYHWLTHDFNVKANGSIWSVIREDRIIEEDGINFRISNNKIIEMDMSGNIIWEWSLIDNLAGFEDGSLLYELMIKHKNDNPFHINSLDFADYDYCYKLFKEPVVVVSSRNMNKVFLIGRNSNKIVFELNNCTIGQHHV